ncbi:hypothetical protein Rsub_08058 [Raphidocelis subcapitata]|uniref:AI-2E family transporter n=1 Tax=Raphidocelis subcapitata TaxID=307507 RepID=A0A2V0PFV1_9CHLO|nr:hypothetical protein Rsub_08058 [Raphidocelis subcapitata]|eukprot:GBF95935.1 hypothetical protein Rsub_08058 [Raphidocelis subcapitata]
MQRCSCAPAGLSSLDAYETLYQPSELQRLINAIPYRRLCIWGVVALAAWQLHEFFGIAMGTFIVSFIGHSFIAGALDTQPLRWLSPDLDTQRRILVSVYYQLLLQMAGSGPDARAASCVRRCAVMEAVERVVLLSTTNDITRAAVEAGDWTAERSVQLGLAVSGMLKGYTTTAATIITAALKSVTRFTIQARPWGFGVFVALILGFFTLWDLPTISKAVASLKHSRLAPVYEEVAPARIAAVNTALTALGMWALAIPGVGLLSLFVFVCSFIPIAGVIISTTPIGFVALTEYGFMKLALVLLLVAGVHFVEAYGLNPAIYSAHLKLHPLLVLCALVVAEHSLGVWGLLLAVPLTVFALDYLIRYPEYSVTEVGAKELRKVMRTAEEDGGDPAAAGAQHDPPPAQAARQPSG